MQAASDFNHNDHLRLHHNYRQSVVGDACCAGLIIQHVTQDQQRPYKTACSGIAHASQSMAADPSLGRGNLT